MKDEAFEGLFIAMSVTLDDVKKVSRLARIKMYDDNVDALCSDLNSVLNFVNQLNDVDCLQIDESLQYVSTLHEREDIAENCDSSVMEIVPFKECNMFIVPKVIG